MVMVVDSEVAKERIIHLLNGPSARTIEEVDLVSNVIETEVVDGYRCYKAGRLTLTIVFSPPAEGLGLAVMFPSAQDDDGAPE